MNNAITPEAQLQFSVLSGQLEQLLNTPAPAKPLVRLEQPAPMINLLGWLSMQSCGLRAYWRDREKDMQIAGLGRCWEQKLSSEKEIAPAFRRARAWLKSLPAGNVHCFSYLSFSDESEQIWQGFGYGAVFLPVLEIVETRKGATIVVNLRADSHLNWQNSIRNALALIRSLNYQQVLENTPFKLEPESFLPDLSGWIAMMNQAFHAFERKELDKVVLSREAKFSVEGALSPWYLMHCWQLANPHSYHFIVENDAGQFFLGCSPEKLIKRQGSVITTEALAGTSRRGRNNQEDIQLEQQLMNDPKNVHENRLVLRDIRERLGPLCQSLETDRSHSILKLKKVQHLRYLIRGVLHDEINDDQLVAVLHPTPAVGGTPRCLARKFIDHHESYSRGLYAGPMGVLGIDHSEFCVAIRSARLSSDALSLFAGAGIVPDSDIQEEWHELNNKIATVSGILDRLSM